MYRWQARRMVVKVSCSISTYIKQRRIKKRRKHGLTHSAVYELEGTNERNSVYSIDWPPSTRTKLIELTRVVNLLALNKSHNISKLQVLYSIILRIYTLATIMMFMRCNMTMVE